MIFFEDNMDPKKFSSYDEYLEALSMKEEFLGKVEAVDKLSEEAKTEEEYRKGMENLGFTYCEDEYCKNAWCAKNRQCLKVEIDVFQDEFNEMFFDDLLSEKDKIITDEMCREDFENECGLPESWHKMRSMEHKAVLFLFTVGEILFFNRKAFSKKLLKYPQIKAFCRNCFLFVQAILYKRFFGLELISEMKLFLKKNKVFSKIESDWLSRLLEGLIKLNNQRGSECLRSE